MGGNCLQKHVRRGKKLHTLLTPSLVHPPLKQSNFDIYSLSKLDTVVFFSSASRNYILVYILCFYITHFRRNIEMNEVEQIFVFLDCVQFRTGINLGRVGSPLIMCRVGTAIAILGM